MRSWGWNGPEQKDWELGIEELLQEGCTDLSGSSHSASLTAFGKFNFLIRKRDMPLAAQLHA